jgi:GTPase
MTDPDRATPAEPAAPAFTGPTRAGFVAIIGATNAGKSTLVNRLVGTKVSIVSRKVQTTRGRIRGIAMHGGCQLVLVDTPGIFRPRRARPARLTSPCS